MLITKSVAASGQQASPSEKSKVISAGCPGKGYAWGWGWLRMAGSESWRCWSVWRGEWFKKQSYLSWSIKLRRWSLTSEYSMYFWRQFRESLISGQLLCCCTKLVWFGNGCRIPNALVLPASSCRVCEPVNWLSCCTTFPREGSRRCFELHNSVVPCSCSVPLIDFKNFPRNLKSTNCCITPF